MFALFRVKESRNNLQGIYAVTFLTLAILMALPSFLFLFYGFAVIFFWKPKYKFISYLNINVDQSTKPLLQSGGESSNQTLLDNGLES